MDKTLSVLFNLDRTYVLLTERSEKGITLLDINSTEIPINIQDISDDLSIKAMVQLKEIINDMGDFDRIAISLPADFAMISQIPGKADMPNDELLQLIIIEIKQLYPHLDYKNFVINSYPMLKDKNGTEKVLIVLIAKEDLQNFNNILSEYGKEIEKIEISHLNAYQSYLFNYPELKDDNVVICCIQNNFIDFSVFSKGYIAYYNLVSYSDEQDIPQLLESEFNIALSKNVDTIQGAYFYGSGLTKDINLSCWEISMMLGLESKRLNPFRKIFSNLDKRQKEYCSRVFHLYPSCFGAGLPSNPTKIRII